MLPVLIKRNRLAPLIRDVFGHSELLNEFDGLVGQLLDQPYDWRHACDIWDDQDAIYVEMEMPGVNAEQVNVSYEGGVLRIEGETKTLERKGQEHLSQRRFGKFTRTYRLPDVIDPKSITAGFKDGILTVKLTKKAETKPRKIPIDTE